MAMGRTKWEIEWTRVADMERQLAELETAIREKKRSLTGLSETRCGLPCSGCGKVLETERDFAMHFLIADSRYLNLGECPRTDKGRVLLGFVN